MNLPPSRQPSAFRILLMLGAFGLPQCSASQTSQPIPTSQPSQPIPQAPTGLGCHAKFAQPPGTTTDQVEKDIEALLQTDVAMLSVASGYSLTLAMRPGLKNAYAIVTAAKTATIQFGRPFARQLWDYGHEFAIPPNEKRWLAGVALRSVLYHEFAHAVQLMHICDASYTDPTKAKWFELEADAIAGAFLTVLLQWDPAALRVALNTVYSLGDNDYNLPDPHGFPIERVQYAMRGRDYVKQVKIDVTRLHKELFGQDLLPTFFAVSPAARVEFARNALATVNSKETATLDNAVCLFAPASQASSPVSLYGFPRDSWKWSGSFGNALRSLHALDVLSYFASKGTIEAGTIEADLWEQQVQDHLARIRTNLELITTKEK